MGYVVHGLWNSPGLNTGGVAVPSPGDLPDPGIEPRSPALQVDSLPTELPGKLFHSPVLLSGFVSVW